MPLRPDGDHQKQVKYVETGLGEKEPSPIYEILTKQEITARKIFTAAFNLPYDARKRTTSPNLTGKTVGISGSQGTKGSPGTMIQTTQIRREESAPPPDFLLSP